MNVSVITSLPHVSSDEMKRRRDFYAEHPVDGESEHSFLFILFLFQFNSTVFLGGNSQQM